MKLFGRALAVVTIVWSSLMLVSCGTTADLELAPDDMQALELAARALAPDEIKSDPNSLRNRTYKTTFERDDISPTQDIYIDGKHLYLSAKFEAANEGYRIAQYPYKRSTFDGAANFCLSDLINDCFRVIDLDSKEFEKLAKKACEAGYQGKDCQFLTFNNFEVVAELVLEKLALETDAQTDVLEGLAGKKDSFESCLDGGDPIPCAASLYKSFLILILYDEETLEFLQLTEPDYILVSDAVLIEEPNVISLFNERSGDTFGLRKDYKQNQPKSDGRRFAERLAGMGTEMALREGAQILLQLIFRAALGG